MAEREDWRKDQMKGGSRIVVRGRGFKILKRKDSATGKVRAISNSKLLVVWWRGSMW